MSAIIVKNQMISDNIRKTLRDYLQFLSNPKDEQDENQSSKNKFKTIITLYAINIPVVGLLAFFNFLFEKLKWINIDEHSVVKFLEEESFVLILILIVIVGPFFEELIFRLFLTFKRNYVLKFYLDFNPNSKDKTLKFWYRFYPYVFYLSAILFAFTHISNYQSDNIKWFMAPLLVMPQFILGLLLGYIRVRYNFLSGYLVHAFHNLIFITPGLLFL